MKLTQEQVERRFDELSFEAQADVVYFFGKDKNGNELFAVVLHIDEEDYASLPYLLVDNNKGYQYCCYDLNKALASMKGFEFFTEQDMIDAAFFDMSEIELRKF